MACDGGYVDVVKTLLENGANIEAIENVCTILQT
jgi:hypothetical protein